MKLVNVILFGVFFAILLATGCASEGMIARQDGSQDGEEVQEVAVAYPQGVARYLAWFEGDYQTDYQVNRQVADERLRELERNPPKIADSDNYLEWASLMDAAGRNQEAAKKLREYLAQKPTDKRAVFLLAIHYWRTNKKELTQYFFAQLEKEEKFPWKSLLYNNLGMLALQDKDRQRAIDYFEKATKSEPRTAAPYVNLGALYLQSRSFGVAESAFRKAWDLDEEFEDAALGLGIALEGQKKFDNAHQVYKDYMVIKPSALSVVYNDSVLLGNRLARKEEASQQMLRYIQRGGKETARAQEILQSWR